MERKRGREREGEKEREGESDRQIVSPRGRVARTMQSIFSIESPNPIIVATSCCRQCKNRSLSNAIYEISKEKRKERREKRKIGLINICESK